MRMKDQVAGPGVQDTDQADLPADITRIKSEFLSSLGRSLKEQRVENFLIGAYQGTQLSRQSKSQEEIWSIQEQILLHLQPILSELMLTFGTMSVAAGVITVLKLMTGGTAKDLPAQLFGAAMLNSPHCLTMRGQEFVSIFVSIGGTIFSKEVSEF
jgi:hypothetical protein